MRDRHINTARWVLLSFALYCCKNWTVCPPTHPPRSMTPPPSPPPKRVSGSFGRSLISANLWLDLFVESTESGHTTASAFFSPSLSHNFLLTSLISSVSSFNSSSYLFFPYLFHFLPPRKFSSFSYLPRLPVFRETFLLRPQYFSPLWQNNFNFVNNQVASHSTFKNIQALHHTQKPNIHHCCHNLHSNRWNQFYLYIIPIKKIRVDL